jgi:hypothetical protein
VQSFPERSATTKEDTQAEPGMDAGLRSGLEPADPTPGVVLPGSAAPRPTLAAPSSAALTEGDDARMLEGVLLLPGITNFLLPNAVAGPGLDSGLMPLNLTDLLRRPPLSLGEIESGRMEIVFSCRLSGAASAQFWRLKSAPDASGCSARGGSRATKTKVSEQMRLQRGKDLQRQVRMSLKQIKSLPFTSLPINSLPINSLPINSLPINSLPINSLLVEAGRAEGDSFNNHSAAGDAVILSAEASAEEAVMEYAGQVTVRERVAKAAFWAECLGVRVPSGTNFEPWVNTKVFTAADCLSHSLESTSRHWFQIFCEKGEIEKLIAQRSERAAPWAETLKKVQRIQQRFLRAGFAWDTYVALSSGQTSEGQTSEGQRSSGQTSNGQTSNGQTSGNDPAAATEWLVAWIEAIVGGTYLYPLMARSSPGAGPETLRRELLLEIQGGMASLGADALPVLAFSRLPRTVAHGVRALHTNVGNHVERLMPETQCGLLSLNAPIPDPLAALLGKEGSGAFGVVVVNYAHGYRNCPMSSLSEPECHQARRH